LSNTIFALYHYPSLHEAINIFNYFCLEQFLLSKKADRILRKKVLLIMEKKEKAKSQGKKPEICKIWNTIFYSALSHATTMPIFHYGHNTTLSKSQF